MNSTLHDMLNTLTKLDQNSTDPRAKESIQILMNLLISDQHYGLLDTSILNDSNELNKRYTLNEIVREVPDKIKINFEGE